MLSKFKKFISIMVVVVMFSSIIVGCQKEQKSETPPPAEKTETAKTLKAAMLLSGPINDGGWNTDAYNGLMKLKDMGFETAYTENVKQSDQESIVREYAKKGYNFIIGHGFEYGDVLTKVAVDFPNIKFLQIGGAANNGKNLASGEFKLGELAVVVAGIAAKTTKTNKVGFVGAMEIPTIQAEVATFKEVVPQVNPKASVTVAYIGSWTDINKGKEAALAQINNGVDVIIGIGDACDAGAIQACQEKGVKFIGWSGDFNKLAPDTVLTSGVQSVSTIVEEVGKKVLEDKFVAEHKIYGVKEGAMWLGEFSPTLDPKVKEEALQQQDDIKTGKLVTKNLNQ